MQAHEASPVDSSYVEPSVQVCPSCQMTPAATTETIMSGIERRIDWVRCLSSVMRERSMKARSEEKA